MTHPQILTLLARLHVDPLFRQAFLTDSTKVLESLGLADADREAFSRLGSKAVLLIGRMADFHRWARIEEHLPWVSEILRPDLASHMSRHAAETAPQLSNRDEALAFCRSLEAALPAEPPYLSELARYERLRISMAWGTGGYGTGTHVEAFEYPILLILQALGEPGWPAFERSPSRVSFKKVPRIPAVLVRGEAIK